MDAKSGGVDSDVIGISERDVEHNRNNVRGRETVDVKRKAAWSTHAAIKALADRLGMPLFYNLN